MKKIIILSILILSGCMANKPIKYAKPPVQTNKKAVLDIRIEDDFSRFGKNVTGAWLCKKNGVCILHLPRITSQFDSYGWCMWGMMLGRSVFGGMGKPTGVECADYYRGK